MRFSCYLELTYFINFHRHDFALSLVVEDGRVAIGGSGTRDWIELYQPGYDRSFLEHLLWVSRSEKLVRAVAPYPIYFCPNGRIEQDLSF